MLNLENSLNSEIGSLLNCEWFILERVKSARGGEINHDVIAIFDFQCERLDDTLPGIIGIADGTAGVQSQ